MDPTLPASCTRSRITVAARGSMVASCGRSTTNPTLAGDSSPLISRNKASGITTILIAARAYSTGASGIKDSEATSTDGTTPRASAALHKWSPSIQNRPALRYAVLSVLSLRSSLSSVFSRELMTMGSLIVGPATLGSPEQRFFGAQGKHHGPGVRPGARPCHNPCDQRSRTAGTADPR